VRTYPDNARRVARPAAAGGRGARLDAASGRRLSRARRRSGQGQGPDPGRGAALKSIDQAPDDGWALFSASGVRLVRGDRLDDAALKLED